MFKPASSFSVEFARCLCLCAFLPTVQRHAGDVIGDSKLPVFLNGCLFICVNQIGVLSRQPLKCFFFLFYHQIMSCILHVPYNVFQYSCILIKLHQYQLFSKIELLLQKHFISFVSFLQSLQNVNFQKVNNIFSRVSCIPNVCTCTHECRKIRCRQNKFTKIDKGHIALLMTMRICVNLCLTDLQPTKSCLVTAAGKLVILYSLLYCNYICIHRTRT